MTSTQLITIVSAFLASLVEFVEAVTIVLAVGVTRQWRSTLIGTAAAAAILSVLVVVFGAAIVMFVPIDLLRLIVGGFLVIYGLQWLTKAILRAGGAKGKHDEDAIYAREVAQMHEEPPVPQTGMDWISFTVAFKGVFLEGLEVAFIVVTFGASAGMLGPAAVGAAIAGVVVLAVAVVVHRPLTRVPENALKFAVGLMLVSFGTFWAGEGVGIDWPAEDATILLILAGYLAYRWRGCAWCMRMRACRPDACADGSRVGRRTEMTLLARIGRFWYDFLVGDRPELFVGPLVVLAIAWGLVAAGVAGALAGVALFVGIAIVGAISIVSQSG